MLVVTIEKIETNRATAYSSSLLAPYAVDPASHRRRVRTASPKRVIWQHRQGRRRGPLTDADMRPAPLTLPLRPMLGCVGVAPARKEAIATATPGAFGGNMDYAGLTAGVKVMLPVNEPGALLFIGDGHARQGEGEVVGTGTRDVDGRRVHGRPGQEEGGGWPRLENDTHLMTLGSARPLLQALQHATSEMQRWLVADYGFSERGASVVHGPGARDTSRQRRRSELHRRGQGAQGAAAAALAVTGHLVRCGRSSRPAPHGARGAKDLYCPVRATSMARSTS